MLKGRTLGPLNLKKKNRTRPVNVFSVIDSQLPEASFPQIHFYTERGFAVRRRKNKSKEAKMADEIALDLEELRQLQSVAKRPRIVSLINSEISNLEKVFSLFSLLQ